MTDLSYKNEEGNNVFTSQYLRNKRTCCKAKCLHCPYGYTLETLGLEFIPVTARSMDRANEIISSKSQSEEESSVASSLLASAYGGNKKKSEAITAKSLDKFFFIKLKGHECGVVKKGILQLKKIYLKEYFQDQGLDLHSVNSHYEEFIGEARRD